MTVKGPGFESGAKPEVQIMSGRSWFLLGASNQEGYAGAL